MSESYGDQFQSLSKYQRGRLPAGRLDWARRPPAFKSYPGAPRVALPPPDPAASLARPLGDALRARRSVRSYSPRSLSTAELSTLLWASQGISRLEQGFAFRTAPSAGALYPIETYVSAQNVAGLEAGLYHHDVREHALELVRPGDPRHSLARAALDQDFLAAAPAVFVWTAVFARSKWKYRQRAYRYVYLDAGHIAQNLALAAVALGLGSCQIAALYDDEVNGLLGLDGVEESVVYMSAVGR
ncbi:MAG: SagB/ThcOx family dehydrogenase [Candidatus Aminicenantes bacterium]|nr:SagB/ThcOx family dehydrogenase [Candidatus Aminicenantes bacterium]